MIRGRKDDGGGLRTRGSLVVALACIEVLATLLAMASISGLGMVKTPCLGISSTGLDAEGSLAGFVLSFVFATPADDGQPDRMDTDSSPPVLATARMSAGVIVPAPTPALWGAMRWGSATRGAVAEIGDAGRDDGRVLAGDAAHPGRLLC